MSRLGFFGGSFDPIHNGHLSVARRARDACSLEKVFFIPAGQNPLKADAPKADEADRLKMVQIAIQRERAFDVIDFELNQEELSFTYRTVEYLAARYPEHELFWIIGSDNVKTLHRWFRIDDLTRWVTFLVYERPGTEGAEPRPIANLSLTRIPGTLSFASSTEVREAISSGRPTTKLLPDRVRDYIHHHQLYLPGSSPEGRAGQTDDHTTTKEHNTTA